MILSVFLVSIFGLSLWYIYHKLTYWERQGIVSTTFLQRWHNYRKGTVQPIIDQECLQTFGSIYGTYEYLTPILMIADPDLIRQILVKDFDKFPNHKPFRIGIPVLDQNLFSLDGGEDWKRIRSLLTPTFTSGKLRWMHSIVNEAIEKLLEHFGNMANDSKGTNIRRLYNSLAFDVIIRCAYSTRVDIIADPQNPILKNFENLFSPTWQMVLTMFLPKLSALLGVQKEAGRPFNFFENMSKQILEDRSKSGRRQNDFLQAMIDAREETPTGTKTKLNKTEMMAQSLIFLIGGFETTATALSCLAYHLAIHPEVQDKLTAEVSGLKMVDHDSVMELKYLDAVVKESLRLSPPGTRVSRECVMESKVGNILVKPGTIVTVSSFAMHRDPNYFTNPDKFNPDRFLAGGTDVNHHPFAFLPFGGGPRTCIAQRFALMEVKMTMARVLQKYHFEATPETMLDYSPATFGILNPQDIILRIKPLT